MNAVELLKKINELADIDNCGVDEISEKDISKYNKHRGECIYCNAKQTLNEVYKDLYLFNLKFNIVE